MKEKRNYTFDGHPIYLLGERAVGYVGQRNVQNFHSLRKVCIELGTLFEDSEFPASDKSLFLSNGDGRRYEWLRPKEISKNPKFFVDSYSRFDVQQGKLGDCWLLAAVTNLTLDDNLFRRVVCDDNSLEENYAGIFHFRFWHYGKWIEVVIDDRLPTLDGKLVNMHSTEKNEYWSALLEKAYAKLYGCYEALKGGNASEAFEDFTGGVSEMYDIKQAPSNFFNILEKASQNHSMMACSIEADPNNDEALTPEGLIKGHAYSITKVKMLDIKMPHKSGKIPLIRLRNPWGDESEWNGAWSDKSPEWRFIPEYEKQKIGLTFEGDGEFWISLKDFLIHFDKLDICNLSPRPLTGQKSNLNIKWNLNIYEGEWIAGRTAGGCRNNIDTFHRNPQYVIKLEHSDENYENCSAIITLMQKNRRNKRNLGLKFLTIGFTIYCVTESELAEKPLKDDFFKRTASTARSLFLNTRSVSARFKLQPGYYLIVPSTFEPNKEGEFLIRAYSENMHTFEENIVSVGMVDVVSMTAEIHNTTSERLTIEQLFLDVAGPNQEIGWMELKQLLDYFMRKELFKHTHLDAIENSKESDEKQKGSINNLEVEFQGFSKDTCRSIIAMLDVDRSGKMGLDEFRTFLCEFARWRAVFRLHDKDQNQKLDAFELNDALESAGYHLNNQIINSLIYRYGSSDKAVPFDDFIICAVKMKIMFDHFKEKDHNNRNEALFTANEWILNALYS